LIQVKQPIFDDENNDDPLPNPSKPKNWVWSSKSTALEIDTTSITLKESATEPIAISFVDEMLGYGT